MGSSISKWDERFLMLVSEILTWSKDPSTKCACLIVRPDRSIVSYGYNDFPSTIKDTPERWDDRPTKYELVVHAEVNALLAAREDVTGYAVYVNTIPCCRCAVTLIQAGISRVIHLPPTEDYLARWGESSQSTLGLFKEAGIPCYWE